MSTKIAKCLIVDNAIVPYEGCEVPNPCIIAPDDAGVLWYWHLTPEDIEAERVASEEAAKAYREANA